MKKVVKAAAIACFALSAAILSALFVKSAGLPDSFMVESGGQLHIDESIEPQSLAKRGTTPESYDVQLKMFGIFPIKNVNVSEVPAKCVVPCGTPFGIKMFTDGVMVVGLTEVDTANGLVNPAKQAGIKIGDTILEMNGIKVRGNSDIVKIIQQSKGGEVSVVVKRKQAQFTVSFCPVISKTDGCYKAGLWVRDSSAGIGTVTFYDKSTGVFGGLGHPVCDIDTGEIMPLMSGEVVNVTITDVNKGLPGLPG